MIIAGNIIADERGLSWTSRGRKHHALWEDVTGYYDQRKPGTDPYTKFAVADWQRVIKTRSGTLTFNEGDWNNERQLRDWVRQYATSAALQSWGEMRRQPNDWPDLFRYNTIITQNTVHILHWWHLGGIAAVVLYFGWMWETAHTLPGWEWLLTPSGIFFAGKQALLLATRAAYRMEKPYLNRKVRADMDGLTFFDGDKRERISWDEITDFYMQGRMCVVRTASGEQNFPTPLDPCEYLRRIVRRYAINTKPKQWRQHGKARPVDSTTWYQDKTNYGR